MMHSVTVTPSPRSRAVPVLKARDANAIVTPSSKESSSTTKPKSGNPLPSLKQYESPSDTPDVKAFIEQSNYLRECERGRKAEEEDLADLFQTVQLDETEIDDEPAVESDPPNSAEEQFRLVCLTRCSEYLDDEDEDDDSAVLPWGLDDFDIVGSLGSGAAGAVYKASERQSGFQIALKVQETTEEGLCEMDIHCDLRHPGIIKMIDYFYSDEPIDGFDSAEDHDNEEANDSRNSSSEDSNPKVYLIFILELCKEALFDTIRSSKDRFIDEYKAAHLFYQVFDAMDYLHSQDIIHCDIKSLNFLLSNDGTQLKLADFGMAVRDDEKEVVGGSPVYMSPEHLLAWRTMDDNFDHRSDIYSLGVVLYEALVGYLPYQVVNNDEDYKELLQDCLADDSLLDLRKIDDCTAEEPIYVPPPIFPDFLSRDAESLIERLMAANPERRITLEEAKEHRWFKSYGLGM